MADSNKKVLLIEDETPMRKALADAMTQAGFVPLQAQDGEEGLQMAFQQHPDLLLLDILMPKLDGMEVMKRLRADEWGKTAPVILLTNVSPDMDATIKAVSEHQPAYYLIKSDMTLDGIVDKIKEVLNPDTQVQSSLQ